MRTGGEHSQQADIMTMSISIQPNEKKPDEITPRVGWCSF